MIKAVVKIYGIDLLLFVIIPDYRFAGHHAIASVILTQREMKVHFYSFQDIFIRKETSKKILKNGKLKVLKGDVRGALIYRNK